MLLLKLLRGTTVVLFEFGAKQQEKKEDKLREKLFCKTLVQVGVGLEEVQKQGRDENTKRLSCYKKIVVNKDWKTTLLLLPDYATNDRVVFQSFFTTIFLSSCVFISA